MGVVPAPLPFDVTELEVPCWTCPSSKQWRLRFQTNLDLLAPLGNGPANAADWFGLFAKEVGPRGEEGIAAVKRGIEGPEWLGTVLPPDDPLLLEAEPWCDQATMSFYPDIFPLNGYSTRITNLLFAIKLVRSWVARGEAAESNEKAMADFRRAIRLGRLLRQEDTVVISDLVGLACIHIATRAVYDRALADGDLELALLASVIIGEVAPQRLGTKKHLICDRGGRQRTRPTNAPGSHPRPQHHPQPRHTGGKQPRSGSSAKARERCRREGCGRGSLEP
jgi:hypothetical protein